MSYGISACVGLLVVCLIALCVLIAHVMDMMDMIDDLHEAVEDMRAAYDSKGGEPCIFQSFGAE